MKYLKQRVPVGFLQPDGRTVEINREFGDDIEKLVETFVGGGSSDVTALLAAISALQSSITTTNNNLAALIERVEQLEDSYQS